MFSTQCHLLVTILSSPIPIQRQNNNQKMYLFRKRRDPNQRRSNFTLLTYFTDDLHKDGVHNPDSLVKHPTLDFRFNYETFF